MSIYGGASSHDPTEEGREAALRLLETMLLLDVFLLSLIFLLEKWTAWQDDYTARQELVEALSPSTDQEEPRVAFVGDQIHINRGIAAGDSVFLRMTPRQVD